MLKSALVALDDIVSHDENDLSSQNKSAEKRMMRESDKLVRQGMEGLVLCEFSESFQFLKDVGKSLNKGTSRRRRWLKIQRFLDLLLLYSTKQRSTRRDEPER